MSLLERTRYSASGNSLTIPSCPSAPRWRIPSRERALRRAKVHPDARWPPSSRECASRTEEVRTFSARNPPFRRATHLFGAQRTFSRARASASLPLDRARRLAGHVEHDPVDLAELVRDAVR